MSATTDLSRQCHPLCLVCGSERTDGLGLRFEQQPDGNVTAEFDCSPLFQGYPDRLHGGVIAMLLDAGMTHCLFARNIAGLTAKLNIRYNQGVMLGISAMVRARVVDSEEPLYYLEAEVLQNGHICAAAKATFWNSAHGEPIEGIASESAETSDPCSPSASQTRRRSL